MLLMLLLLVILPLSLIFWLLGIVLFSSQENEAAMHAPTPWRWIFALLVPIIIIRSGLRKKSLNLSGAIVGLAVGFILSISNYCFFASLLAFFVTASKATKFREAQKRHMEDDFKEGGQRNWIQVLCNGGIASEIAIFFIMETGCWEPTISFSRRYNVSWLCMSALGALACSCGDTYASELGTVLSKGDPFLITTFRRVPKGTNGGVSIWGLLASLLGGLVVGVAYYAALLLCTNPATLMSSPPQWPVVFIGGLAGFIGSIIDSILGSTLQFSGYDPVKQCIVEIPGEKVQTISGMPLFDNHSVNLISSFIMCLLTPSIALSAWEYFI